MRLISTAFKEGEKVPQKYSCDGENLSPPLSWSGVPESTKSFVLIMDDPDIPDFVKKARGIEVFDHWIVYNIPLSVSGVEEGIGPEGVAGSNSAGKIGYTGPCPPDREHRYFFQNLRIRHNAWLAIRGEQIRCLESYGRVCTDYS